MLTRWSIPVISIVPPKRVKSVIGVQATRASSRIEGVLSPRGGRTKLYPLPAWIGSRIPSLEQSIPDHEPPAITISSKEYSPEDVLTLFTLLSLTSNP